MELKLLLKDEVFVDFFNTFLNLPVFGQTPLYMLSKNKWLMWPNLPFCQVNKGAFLYWLQTHRMAFFKQTELYHSFVLVSEILNFVSCRTAGDLKWTPADQWLLRKCLGSVRGIQRFRSFLKNSDEEDLLLFCVRVSMLLEMKEEKSESTFLTLNHLSLLTAIRQYDISGLLSRDQSLISQKSVLVEMRMKALNQLQSYWLPHFLHSCKSWLWRVPKCRPLVEKYMSFTSSSSPSNSNFKQELIDLDSQVNPATSYSSQQSKQQLWCSHMPSSEQLQPRSICLWLPTADQKNSQCTNVAHLSPKILSSVQDLPNKNADVPHKCVSTPSFQIPLCLSVQSPPSDLHCFLQPALSAERLSGGPFRGFLRTRELWEKQNLLDLLEDLDFFLLLLLRSQGSNLSCEEIQVAAKRITETHLKGSENVLDPDTLLQLRSLLPSGSAVPWIYTAKHQICRELQDVYNSFLESEDKTLLSILSSSEDELKDSESLHFSYNQQEALQNQTESLVLSERCCSRMEPTALSQDDWALLVLQDPQREGPLKETHSPVDAQEDLMAAEQTESMIFVTDLHVSKTSVTEGLTRTPKKGIIHEKPSSKPRSFEQAIQSTQYIHHFKQFLQDHKADGALLFLQNAEALRNIEQKRQNQKIRSIVDKFFRREDREVYLQCNADIIKNVAKMDPVPPEVIYTVQKLVSKSLEAIWFRQYQQSFSSSSIVSESESSIREPMLKGNVRGKVWGTFKNFLRSVHKFKFSMRNREIRFEFEDFLINNDKQFSTSYTGQSKPNMNSELSSFVEKFRLKIRSIREKVVIVNFLVNDLSFFLECERFRHMADIGDVMALEGMYSETDYAMLIRKAEVIINGFLSTQMSPKILINSSESQKDIILQRFASGRVDRTLFYQPMIDVLPALVICWRRFCGLRVMKQMFPHKASILTSHHRQLHSFSNNGNIKTIICRDVSEATLRFSAQHGLILLLPQMHKAT